MSAFEKGKWLEQFKSKSRDADQAKVRAAYREPIKSPGRRPRTEAVRPVGEIRSPDDLPIEMTPRQIAERMTWTLDMVYAAIYRRELYALKVGKRWRVPFWALVTYLQNREANVG